MAEDSKEQTYSKTLHAIFSRLHKTRLYLGIERQFLRIQEFAKREPRIFLGSCLLAFFALAGGIYEARSSYFQSFYFAAKTKALTFRLEAKENPNMIFPEFGPFDERLGYTLLPQLLSRLKARGFEIYAQMRHSPQFLSHHHRGLYPIYEEKSQAGLTILDHEKHVFFTARHPQLVYEAFSDIPSVIVKTLLFIENRDLLDPRYPYRNPTIEWDRLAKAAFGWGLSHFLPDYDVAGGSTLATQIEKYRHSKDGLTSSPKDKWVQMLSASYRSYLDGRSTLKARQRVVRDYINSVPLGAIPGGGEVRGLGHGLAAWHGASLKEVNELLSDESLFKTNDKLEAQAQAYKQVLSLFLAQRRPAYYLQSNRKALTSLTDRHLSALVKAGIITEPFKKALSHHELQFRNNQIVFQPEKLDFVERKAANAIRIHLLPLFDFDRLYTLDRLDLEAVSTLDYAAQTAVSEILTKLKDKEFAEQSGLMGERLLAKGDPSELIYSFTLMEQVGDQSLLRVQADNVDGPFNVSEGGKLELGSTAKLRTLVTYLEIIAELWQRYRQETPSGLKQALSELSSSDPLTRWAIEWFLKNTTTNTMTLKTMLQQSMLRTYSASPYEAFYTGGGLHHFSNFDPEDNPRIVTALEALEKSINLPFVRMMREIVQYYIAQIPDSEAMLKDFSNPRRKLYLTRFAAKEGRQFLGRFYLKNRELERDQLILKALGELEQTPRRLAAIFSIFEPTARPERLKSFLEKYFPEEIFSEKLVESLYREMFSGGLRLLEKSRITPLHPLELWVMGFLYRSPKASFSQVIEQSTNQRMQIYDWLIQSKEKSRQDTRIRILLEEEAFVAMHAQWQKLGYPFASLVPTLATALGSSGDKPSALAELMGVIVSGGIRTPTHRIEELHFAKDTPFETRLRALGFKGTRVLDQEIAEVLKESLMRVVEAGTAIRVKGAFKDIQGRPLAAGGKTGTGDNRYSIFAPGGRVLESKAMSRTATFVFFIGDRFYGTVTAYVPSSNAENYSFTSALPTQILKILAPKLLPLIQGTPNTP